MKFYTELNDLYVSATNVGQKILDEYLRHVEGYCSWMKVDDNDPDEAFMRSIEEQIDISENAKRVFREEILIRISTYERRGKKFTLDSHARLREAIEKHIIHSLQKSRDEQARVKELTKMVEQALKIIERGDMGLAKAAIDDAAEFVAELVSE